MTQTLHISDAHLFLCTSIGYVVLNYVLVPMNMLFSSAWNLLLPL
jgi:hypothetical protein